MIFEENRPIALQVEFIQLDLHVFIVVGDFGAMLTIVFFFVSSGGFF